MSILVDSGTRVIVQNITGREGRFHTREMIAYGTHVVAGVTPGHGGEEVEGVPVFDSVRQAVSETAANATVVFVPAAFGPDAIIEAVEGGISLIVCITEGIPTLEMVKLYGHVRRKGARLLGPNCPGLIVPGSCKLGIMPASAYSAGPVGIVSRSGTLGYDVAANLTRLGVGQSTCVGIGGDPIIGTSFVDVLSMFEEDPRTRVIGLIGEIGGFGEEEAAEFIAAKSTKPVVALVAGVTAPPEKRMGHAGAVIAAGQGTAYEKIVALGRVGVTIADSVEEMAGAIAAAASINDLE